jgi:hypothetical protein
MTKRIPLIVAGLGKNVDPFMLQIYVALAGKERSMISEPTRDALAKAGSAASFSVTQMSAR